MTFALLLAGAVDLVGQSLLRPVVPAQPLAQPFFLISYPATQPTWLLLNTATGQLYFITATYVTGPASNPVTKRTAINDTSLLASTDLSIPGRFALVQAGVVPYGPNWLLVDQQTGATWIVGSSLVPVPTS